MGGVFGLRILSNIFSIVNTFLLIKCLPTEEYASFRVLLALMVVFFDICNLGLIQSMVRIAIEEFEQKNKGFLSSFLKKIKKIWWFQVLIAFGFTLFYARSEFQGLTHPYYCLGYVYLAGLTYFFGQYYIHLLYSAKKMYAWFSFLAIVSSVKCFALIILVYFMRMGFVGALIAQMTAFLSAFVFAILHWILFRRRFVAHAQKNEPVPFTWKYHLTYGVAHFANIEITNFSCESMILFMKMMLSDQSISCLGIAFSIYYMANTIVVVFANYLFPSLPKYIRSNDHQGLHRMLSHQVRACSLVSFSLIIGFLLFAEPGFNLFFQNYRDTPFYFYYLFPVIAMKPVEYLLVNYVLTVKQNRLFLFKALTLALILTLGMSLLTLFDQISVPFVLILYSVADFSALAVLMLLVYRRLHVNFFRKEYLLWLLYGIVLLIAGQLSPVYRIGSACAAAVLIVFQNRSFLIQLLHYAKKSEEQPRSS